MYSFLAATRQLYGDFLFELFARLLYPAEAQQQQQSLKSSSSSDLFSLFLSLLVSLLGMFLYWFLLLSLFLLILLAFLHRPLPPMIADRKKIALFEFLMRVSNEYFGSLVELCFGTAIRNRLTRALSALCFPPLPRWLFRWAFRAHWCDVRNVRIAGVRCRAYLPKGKWKHNDAGIVYIHGGGWCIGRPRFYDGALLYLARKLGVSIVSIDYSLSPEAKFPTALFECEKVIEALSKVGGTEFGIDPNRLALMGDSAGANLCAVLCQRALKTENRRRMVKCQLLVYPVIHMFDFRSPSYQYYYRSYPDTALLNPELLSRWYLMYMGIEPSEKNIRTMTRNGHLSKQIRENREVMELVDGRKLPKGLPGSEEGAKEREERNGNGGGKMDGGGEGMKRNGGMEGGGKTQSVEEEDRELSEQLAPFLLNSDICPLLGKNLEGLCPAMICTAGVDILRDEGILYAQRLRHFGVSVEWKHYEAAYHGILNMCRSRARQRILSDIADYLQRHLLSS